MVLIFHQCRYHGNRTNAKQFAGADGREATHDYFALLLPIGGSEEYPRFITVTQFHRNYSDEKIHFY